MDVVPCRLDTHLWIPDDPDLAAAIRPAVEIPDPRWDPTAAIRPVGSSPVFVATERRGEQLGIHRGVARAALRALATSGYRPRIDDDRVAVPATWPSYRGPELRADQTSAVARILKIKEGIAVLPTGVGKSVATLRAAAESGMRTLIIAPRTNIAAHWEAEARRCFDIDDGDIGRVYNGECTVGAVVTFGLPDSVFPRLERLAPEFGFVAIDEAQSAAAPRLREVATGLPAMYRIGVTADPDRIDRGEIWTRAVLGPVIVRRSRADAESSGSVVPVVLRVVPFDGHALLPRETAARERALLADEARCRALDDIVVRAERGVVVFVRLVESVRHLSARWRAAGWAVGEMIGRGNAGAADEFERTRRGLADGSVEIAVATWSAVGVGTDVPALSSLVMATPPGRGERGYLAFNQNRGRVARHAEGKSRGHVYLLWDRARVSGTASLLASWNDGRVEIADGDAWRTPRDGELLG